MVDRLIRLGLRPEHREQFDAFIKENSADLLDIELGRVARVDRGEVDVLDRFDSKRVLSASSKAQALIAPVTGDWVITAVRKEDEADSSALARVAMVLKRETAITRRDPAEGATDQVLASNVDVIATVHSLDVDFNDARVERFLVLAIDSGAKALLVLTKADLLDGPVSVPDWISDVANVVVTSVVPGEHLSDAKGIDELRSYIGEGDTLAFIGPSGVGKSTLVNALVQQAVVATGEVREGDRKGRHTTTARELVELDGRGVLLDTPGIRSIGLWAADGAIDAVFPDVSQYVGQCKFADCVHTSEPGCALQDAVDTDELSQQRFERYLLLQKEQRDQAEEIRQQGWSKKNRR